MKIIIIRRRRRRARARKRRRRKRRRQKREHPGRRDDDEEERKKSALLREVRLRTDKMVHVFMTRGKLSTRATLYYRGLEMPGGKNLDASTSLSLSVSLLLSLPRRRCVRRGIVASGVHALAVGVRDGIASRFRRRRRRPFFLGLSELSPKGFAARVQQRPLSG